MKDLLLTPKFGMKFLYKNTEYEITSIYLDQVGITTVIGGKRTTWSRDYFEKLVNEDLIKITFNKNSIFLNEKILKELNRKYKYIKQALKVESFPHSFTNLTKTIEIISSEIEDLNPPTTRSLSNWIRTYTTNNFELTSLIDKRKGNTAARKPYHIVKAMYTALENALKKPYNLSAYDIYILIIQYLIENKIEYTEDQLFSIRSIQRYKKKNHDQFTKDSTKNSICFAQNHSKASGQKIKSTGFLNLVEIDSHQLDLLILDDKNFLVKCRPWITLAIDIYTRIVVGMYISEFPPNSYSTLQTIKSMVTASLPTKIGGIPDVIVPDNGSEFINNSVFLIAKELQITLKPAQVKTPDNKPYVERFFRTLAEELIHQLPGTTYSNRIRVEEYDSKKYASLTLKQAEQCILDWINIYHHHLHTGVQRIPLAIYNESIQTYRPTVIDVSYADLICRVPHSRTISNGQIQYENLFYYSHALRILENNNDRNVTIYVNESNLSKIYVKSSNNELIEAISTDFEYTSRLTLNDHYIAQKIKNNLKEEDLKKYPISQNVLSRIILNNLISKYYKENRSKIKTLRKNFDNNMNLNPIPIQKLYNQVEQNNNDNSLKIEFGEFENFIYESLKGDSDAK